MVSDFSGKTTGYLLADTLIRTSVSERYTLMDATELCGQGKYSKASQSPLRCQMS